MASVAFSPNFAVVCSFLERYAALLRLPDFNFAELEAALDDTDEAPNALVELHLRLLKTMGQKVARDRWEKHLAKMCEDFDSPLAWELKNLGYPKMSQANKLILLKFLCETQFDDNVRFKATVNEEEAELMRVQPLGRDRHGLVYWIHTDGHFNTRLYTEEQDDLEQSSWKLLSRNREGLAEVLQGLKLAVSGGAGGQEQNSPSCSSSDTEEPTKLPPPYTTAFKLGQKMKENKAETGDSDGKKLEEEGEEEEEEVAPAKKERSEVGEKKGGGASGSPEEAEDEEDSSLMKEAVIKLERLDDTMLEKLSQDTCKEETQAKLPVKKRELRMPTEISPDARPSKSDVDGEAQASGADAGGEGKGVASEGGGAQGTTEGEVENGQNGELGRNGGGSGGGGSGGDVSKGGSVAHKSDAEKDGEDTAAAAPTTRKRGTSATHADRVKDTEKGDSEAVAGNPSKVNGQGSPRRITRQRKAASEEAKKAEEKSSSEEKGSSGESEGDDDGSEESQEEPSEGANIDDSCKRCGLSSHPELILLCDGCDDGYHTACLRPPLMLIPDGDWFCPSCQHKKLCEKMEEELNHLDRMVKKSNRAQRRKEMLTYVGISSENILPRKASYDSVQDDEDEEPVGRQRLERRSSRARKAVSYEYKEFDDAIITAIEEDIKEVKEAKRRMAMEQEAEDSGKEEEEDEEEEEGSTGGASAAAAGGAAPASGPVHRGKDISTILRASGRHSGESDDGATAAAAKPKKRAAGKSSDDDKDEDSDEVDGRRGVVRGARGRKRAPAKRKARRLTALDSFDEESEDEDYQESGTEVEEPDNWVDEFGSGDASSGSDYWQSLSRRPRKPRTEPTRRSQRLRGRPMEEDSDLESSDSEVARAARRAGRNKRSERRTTPARRGTRGNRAIARRKGGRNDSDASESDASHKSSPVAARRAKATATPRKRQTRSSESHESASSASERPVRKRRRAAPAARARSSDEEEEEDEEKAGQRAKPAGSRQRRASGAGGSAQRRQKRPSSARAPVRTPKRKRAARSGRTTTGGAGSSSEEHKEGSGGGGGSGESGEDADEAAIAAGKAQRARDARPRRPRRAAAARGTKAAAAAAAAAAACVSSGEGEGAPPPPARASRRAGATKEGGGGGDDDEDVADDLLGVEDLVDYVTGE